MTSNYYVGDFNGIGQLMRSEEMGAVMYQIAEQVANSLGEGYEAIPTTGNTRSGASVRTTTREAYEENLDGNTLINAVTSGGIGL